MTRICKNCSFENQDEYDFCAKCGTPLVEGLENNDTVFIYENQRPQLNKKAIAIAYILTILLSWSGFVLGLLFKNTSAGVFTFFGFFMPFYLIQAPIDEIRKHGFIMLLISILGVFSSLYVMFFI